MHLINGYFKIYIINGVKSIKQIINEKYFEEVIFIENIDLKLIGKHRSIYIDHDYI